MTSDGSNNGTGMPWLEDRVALDFAAQHANDLRYVAESSQWLRWDGETWQSENTLAAFDESPQALPQGRRRPSQDGSGGRDAGAHGSAHSRDSRPVGP